MALSAAVLVVFLQSGSSKGREDEGRVLSRRGLVSQVRGVRFCAPAVAVLGAHPLLAHRLIHGRNVAKVGGSAIYSCSSISVTGKLKISDDQLPTDTQPRHSFSRILVRRRICLSATTTTSHRHFKLAAVPRSGPVSDCLSRVQKEHLRERTWVPRDTSAADASF